MKPMQKQKTEHKTHGIRIFTAILGIIVISSTLFFSQAFAQNNKIATIFGKSYKTNLTVPKKIFGAALGKFLKLTPAQKKKFASTQKTDWKLAIETLCKAKKWKVSKTFSKCSAHARKHGFLDSPLPAKLKSKTKITYEHAALLLDRIFNTPAEQKPATDATDKINQQPVEQPAPPQTDAQISAVPPRAQIPLSFTPVAELTIGVNFFENIALSSPIPNHFYKDEIYYVEGDVTGATTEDVLIFLCRENASCDDSTNFLEPTTGTHFKIPVHFTETGNFQIGIIPGKSGQSRIEDISVLPEPPQPMSGGQTPANLSVAYDKGKTAFRWDSEGAWTRLVIFQDKQRKDYIFRQSIKTFSPSSKDFQNFKKGIAGWRVEQNAAAPSAIQTINLVTKEFRKIYPEKIQIQTMPETLQTAGQFVFTAKSLSPVSKKAALTLPDGSVKEIGFAEKDLEAQQNFRIDAALETQGAYIFEVNGPEGNALVNVPIYVGSFIPLLPDYFALNEPELDESPLQNLDQARQTLLNLINADRAAHSLPAVALANDLNEVAQAHSANMARLNFFGHTNPAGLGPDDRRKNAKITTPIRENLGKAANLELVEAGLMRSPVHRAAIITPEMERVGLGIVKDSEGYFLVTQNFAVHPTAKTELPFWEDQLFNQANETRAAKGLSQMSFNTVLRKISSSWAAKMADENFFAVTSPSGENLLDTIRTKNIRTSVQMHIVQASDKSVLTDELAEQTGLNNASNLNIGIGIGMNDIGEFFMTTLYTP